MTAQLLVWLVSLASVALASFALGVSRGRRIRRSYVCRPHPAPTPPGAFLPIDGLSDHDVAVLVHIRDKFAAKTAS